MQYNVIVFGLGYVGMPLIEVIDRNKDIGSLQISKIVGYDFNNDVIESLKEFNSNIIFESSFEKVKGHIKEGNNIYIICVPTNVDENNMPDYRNVENVIQTISTIYKENDIIISESTVGVGDTRRLINRYIPNAKFGYCPERLAPDTMHTISMINKVVSGSDSHTLDIVTNLYEKVISNDNYIVQANSVEEAEACKLLENIQRDVNVALLNEYKHYCDKHNISVLDVVDLCSTKHSWSPYVNGMVGGCCIPIDPYYAINNENTVQLGIISKAREVNEKFVTECYNLITKNIEIYNPKNVLILGSAYKVGTFSKQNSKALEIINRLYTNYDNINFDIMSDVKIDLQEQYDMCIVLVPDKKFIEYDIIKIILNSDVLIDLFGLYKNVLSHSRNITI